MTIASGSRHSMAYVEEVTRGTTPASPVFKPLRHTGTTLALTKDGFQSEELRSDRQISDFRHGNKSTGGDVNVELSYTSFDDMIEAALGGTWATDTPVAGTDELTAGVERRYFTIERLFDDITSYIRYTGQEVNTWNLVVEPNAIVSSTFGYIGKGESNSTSPLAGATYDPATTTSPFDSFSGTVNEGGVPTGVVTSIDLTLDNGLEANFAVGDDESIDSSIGRSNVSGTIEIYFENLDLYNKFVNETESSLDFTLVDTAGNTFFVSLPRIKYNSGQPDVADEGPITISQEFQALLDSGTGTNIIVRRTDV